MVVGYFLDRGVTLNKAKQSDIFVVIENESKAHGKFLEGYAPVGQHFGLKDPEYLDECTKITKEEYIKLSKGFYTPSEYL